MNAAGNDHEERITKLEAARKELEDAMLVHARLEANSSKRLEQHEGFLKAHEDAMIFIMNAQRSHEVAMQNLENSRQDFEASMQASSEEFRRQHELAMREFDEKLNALIDIVSRMQGGMESRPNA